MPPRRQAHGRISVIGACALLGISRTEFYDRKTGIRWNPDTIDQLDIRRDPATGAIDLDEAAVVRAAKQRIAARPLAYDPTEVRECPHCCAPIPIRASVCRYCSRDVQPPSNQLHSADR